MSLQQTNRSMRWGIPLPPGALVGALLGLPVLLLALPAAAEERGMATQSASAPAPAPAPYVAPAPAPAPYVAPAPAPEPYVARSAPAPSYEPAPVRSSPPRDPSPSPTTVSTGRSPGRFGGGSHVSPPRGREPSARPGQAPGRTPGYVSTGPRGSGGGWGDRPPRHYHRPSWGWGTSWWWGGPWDWWWWGPGWGWGPYWGWGGVMVVDDGDPLPNRYARIDTDVSPETAEVWLDGTFIGSADDFDGWPDYLYLEPGKYRLEFRHPTYETLVKELEVRRGQRIDLKDDMKLLPGKTRLEAKDPERRGTPLGRVFGKPDAEGNERGDRTGRWEARDRPGRGRPVDMDDPDEVDEPDEDVPPPARAPSPDVRKARPGVEEVAPAERSRFRFEVKPADAAVWLDDKYVGTAEELAGLRRGLAVTPGKHSVTVVRPGYGTKTIDVEGKPGAAIDVVVELEK